MFEDSSWIGPDPTTGLLRRMDFEYKLYKLLLNVDQDNQLTLLHISYDLETISVEDKLRIRINNDLRRIANTVKRRCRQGYVAGRIGPADIGVIAHLSLDDGEVYAKGLCDEIQAELWRPKKGIRKTVSIGVITTTSVIEGQTALHEAERCMIAAKAMGHSRICTTQQLADQSHRAGIPLNLLSLEYRIRVEAERTASDVAFQTRQTILDYIHKAETDPLTGLNNRGYLDKRLSREIDNAQKNSIPLSIALLDADDFGAVNKNFDYPTGDLVLRAISDVLRQGIRTTDWAARYGGEEFCVVMPGTSLADGVRVMERCRQTISECSIPTNKEESLRVTVSCGVIERAESESNLNGLYARASNAVQFAKQKGKDRVAFQEMVGSSTIKIFGDT